MATNTKNDKPEEWEIKFLGFVIKAKNPTLTGIGILLLFLLGLLALVKC
jgi:hypothetical protein